jgi:hypothetical protein
MKGLVISDFVVGLQSIFVLMHLLLLYFHWCILNVFYMFVRNNHIIFYFQKNIKPPLNSEQETNLLQQQDKEATAELAALRSEYEKVSLLELFTPFS